MKRRACARYGRAVRGFLRPAGDEQQRVESADVIAYFGEEPHQFPAAVVLAQAPQESHAIGRTAMGPGTPRVAEIAEVFSLPLSAFTNPRMVEERGEKDRGARAGGEALSEHGVECRFGIPNVDQVDPFATKGRNEKSDKHSSGVGHWRPAELWPLPRVDLGHVEAGVSDEGAVGVDDALRVGTGSRRVGDAHGIVG